MYYYNRIGLGSKIFPFATPQNAVRKLFYFGVGSKKFSRHNEKNLAPQLSKEKAREGD
ncbi:hypothetical protein SJDPG12_08640 [Porphyromonas gingivalis SJD12]|nr:hypothetical protein SJDPG12_08640 [Porphyromonas gingivalis SJD12]